MVSDMRKNTKSLILLTLLLIFSLALVAVFIKPAKVSETDSDNYTTDISPDKLVITNLDVGKGDCAFIEYNGLCGIIDTGKKDSYGTIKEFLDDSNKKTLDFMVITHYDKDHVGSATKLMKDFSFKKIYLPSYISQKSGYSKIMEAVRGNLNVVMVSSTESITEGDLKLNLIPPTDPDELISDEDNMDNNMSLLCLITFKEKIFLFTGDIEKDRIRQILDSETDIKADWIKLPHHGAYKDNMKDFLTAVSPEYSVISTGPERPADNKLLNLLDAMNIKNYSTTAGSIITICDENGITVRYLN